MPENFFPSNDPQTRKQWIDEVNAVAEARMVASRYFGTGSNSAIRIRDALNKGYGDEVTWSSSWPLKGTGTVGPETLKGKEEALTLFTDKMRIDLSRHAVPVGNKIDAQLAPVNLRKIGRDKLGSWKAKAVDMACAYQLAGYTPANVDAGGDNDAGGRNATYRGHNTITAPHADRIIRAGGIATDTLVGADNTAKMTLELIDYAKERCFLETATAAPIEPLEGGKHVLFVHPSVMTDLRRNEEWQAIQLAALSGKQEGNPLYKFAAGEYNDTIIVPWQYLPTGVSATNTSVANTRRSVLVGAEALSLAYGRGYDGGEGDWEETEDDHNFIKYVAYDLIWGVKANFYKSGSALAEVDYGKIVIVTYSAAH